MLQRQFFTLLIVFPADTISPSGPVAPLPPGLTESPHARLHKGNITDLLCRNSTDILILPSIQAHIYLLSIRFKGEGGGLELIYQAIHDVPLTVCGFICHFGWHQVKSRGGEGQEEAERVKMVPQVWKVIFMILVVNQLKLRCFFYFIILKILYNANFPK